MNDKLHVLELEGMMIGCLVMEVEEITNPNNYKHRDRHAYQINLVLPRSNQFELDGNEIWVDIYDFDDEKEHQSCLRCIEDFMDFYDELVTSIYNEEIKDWLK